MSRGDGNGFKLGGRRRGSTGKSGGHTVTQCLTWNNKVGGFDENGEDGGIRPFKIYNNVSFNNARNTDSAFGDPSGNAFVFLKRAETVLRNNIAFATTGQNELAIRLAVHDHNLRNGVAWDAFNPPIRLDATAFGSLDDSIARGPRQPDGSLPISGFLRPKVGSVLIGRGSTQGLPATIKYSGVAPDLGAFQRDPYLRLSPYVTSGLGD